LTADPDQIKRQLALMNLYAQSTKEKKQIQIIATATREIQTTYEDALRTLHDEKSSGKARKDAKDILDAIDKNLPDMVDAMLSASAAFKAGDHINGSAALMNICASGMRILAGFSVAAGPYGVAFAALFGLVGQLLTYFGEEQPSLKDQIIEAIKGLNADEKLRNAQEHANVVDEYTRTVYRMRADLPLLLQLPMKTEEELRTFHKGLDTCLVSINKAHDKISLLYRKWATAEWLKDPKTQELPQWPEILGVFCRTYADSLLANMALASMANPAVVNRRLDDASSKNPDYTKFQHQFDAIYDRLMMLSATVEAIPKLWDDGNDLILRFMQAVEPVARARGLFVYLGASANRDLNNEHNNRNRNKSDLYAATGGKVMEPGDWTLLQMGPYDRGHRFALSIPGTFAGSLQARYRIFFCQHWVLSDNGDMEHGWVDPAAVDISGRAMISPDKFHDVWAIPSPKDRDTSFVYAARNDGNSGAVKLFAIGASDTLKEIGWKATTKSGIVNVRALHHPPATLPGDPHGDAMPPELLQGNGEEHAILYGALASSGDIYVDYLNTLRYVPSPWGSYGGIDVDPYFLWVFGPWGMACATHASVISCLRGLIDKPRWMTHSPDALIGDRDAHEENKWWDRQRKTRTYPPLIGIRSLSPCKDGTLFASIHHRSVTKKRNEDHWQFEVQDTPALYTARYSIDIKNGHLHVDSWSKLPAERQAQQVQKLAIPCWPQFARLKARLTDVPVIAKATPRAPRPGSA
jgi:hypothetical protein